MTSDVTSIEAEQSKTTERKLLFEREQERAIQETFDPDTWRTFACVAEPNTRYQIYEEPPGNPLNEPIHMGEIIAHRNNRVGDKFVEFENGLFFTNDDECIRYCESRYPNVVDMKDASAQTLVALARLQTPRADYEPEITTVSLVDTVGADLLKIKANLQATIDEAVAKERAKWEAQQTERIQTFGVSPTPPPNASDFPSE